MPPGHLSLRRARRHLATAGLPGLRRPRVVVPGEVDARGRATERTRRARRLVLAARPADPTTSSPNGWSSARPSPGTPVRRSVTRCPSRSRKSHARQETRSATRTSVAPSCSAGRPATGPALVCVVVGSPPRPRVRGHRSKASTYPASRGCQRSPWSLHHGDRELRDNTPDNETNAAATGALMRTVSATPIVLGGNAIASRRLGAERFNDAFAAVGGPHGRPRGHLHRRPHALFVPESPQDT